MTDTIEAPFTPDQVLALNRWQQLGYVHPFTCRDRGNGHHGDGEGVLVATVRGWVCPFCDYTQNWAHAIMATEMAPVNPFEVIKQRIATFETPVPERVDEGDYES